jgi:hypothetical protein
MNSCSEDCDAVPLADWFPVSQKTCLHHQGSSSPRTMVLTFSLDCLTMNIKALSSKTVGTAHPMTQRHILVVVHHKKHQCENLKSHTTYSVMILLDHSLDQIHT